MVHDIHIIPYAYRHGQTITTSGDLTLNVVSEGNLPNMALKWVW